MACSFSWRGFEYAADFATIQMVASARLCSSKQWSLGNLEMGARKRDGFYLLKESECLVFKLPTYHPPRLEVANGLFFQLARI